MFIAVEWIVCAAISFILLALLHADLRSTASKMSKEIDRLGDQLKYSIEDRTKFRTMIMLLTDEEREGLEEEYERYKGEF